MRGATRARALAELEGPAELVQLLRMTVLAAGVPWLMRLPIPRSAAILTRAPGCSSDPEADAARILAMFERARRVARPFVRDGCLTRAVTLFWFMRRAGVSVELCFGIDPANADGHCWLVRAGEPFLEKVDPRLKFDEMYRLPL